MYQINLSIFAGVAIVSSVFKTSLPPTFILVEKRKDLDQVTYLAISKDRKIRLRNNPFSFAISNGDTINSFCNGPDDTYAFLQFDHAQTFLQLWNARGIWRQLQVSIAPTQTAVLLYDKKHKRIIGLPAKSASTWTLQDGKLRESLSWQYGGRQPEGFGQYLAKTGSVFYAENIRGWADDGSSCYIRSYKLGSVKTTQLSCSLKKYVDACFPSSHAGSIYAICDGYVYRCEMKRGESGTKINLVRKLPSPKAARFLSFEERSRSVCYFDKMSGRLFSVTENHNQKIVVGTLARHDHVVHPLYAKSSSSGRTICVADEKNWAFYSRTLVGLKLICEGSVPTDTRIVDCGAVLD